MKNMLVVSEEKDVTLAIQSCFRSASAVVGTSNIEAALASLHKKRFDLVFIDLEILRGSVQDNSYKESLQLFWQLYPTIEIIIMTGKEMIRDAVKALKAGASDYITYPVSPEEIKHVANNVLETQVVYSELDYLREQFWAKDSFEFIYSNNSLMKTLYEKILAVAPTKSTVLLLGETGTGKGVMARLLHKQSNRRDNQFISVHCGAIPDTLLESELFGHEKGAFTGAVRRKLGKFEIAHKGTIFLDEIGTLTPSAQIKLLQVLQDGTFQRVGGEETHEADVRVIAATNVNLKQMCDEGNFRKDLYYRLNVFPLEIIPLRERIEDISLLVEGIIKKLNRVSMKNINGIDQNVLEAFKHYPWPGNIRELENVMERAYILETGPILSQESFPGELLEFGQPFTVSAVDPSRTLAEERRKGIEIIERNYLKELLVNNRGKIKESAQAAGITPRQLHKLMSKYGFRKEKFKSAPVSS